MRPLRLHAPAQDWHIVSQDIFCRACYVSLFRPSQQSEGKSTPSSGQNVSKKSANSEPLQYPACSWCHLPMSEQPIKSCTGQWICRKCALQPSSGDKPCPVCAKNAGWSEPDPDSTPGHPDNPVGAGPAPLYPDLNPQLAANLVVIECPKCKRTQLYHAITQRVGQIYCFYCGFQTLPKPMNTPPDQESKPTDRYCSICGASESPTGWWGSAPHFYCDRCSGPGTTTKTTIKPEDQKCQTEIGQSSKTQNPPKPQQIPKSAPRAADTPPQPPTVQSAGQPPTITIPLDIVVHVLHPLVDEEIEYMEQEKQRVNECLATIATRLALLHSTKSQLQSAWANLQKPQ